MPNKLLSHSRPLSYYLKRAHNNFDLLRILLAIVVIVYHAPSLSQSDAFSILFNNPLNLNVGETGLAFFFFLSGLVITNSLLSRPSFIYYTTARFFRIWPGLACVLLISALVIGPLVTSLELSEYFSTPQIYKYIYRNLQMKTQFLLPGVFENNLMNDSVNGSLWTIKWEVKAYFYLFIFIYFLSFKKQLIQILLISAFLLLLFSDKGDQEIFGPYIQAKPYFTIFFLGALFCLLKESIKINWLTALLSVLFLIITFYFKMSYIPQFFAASLVYMHLSFHPLCLKFKPKHEISFSVYIWAFPIAQLFEYYLPNIGIWTNLILVIGTSLCAGYLSWIYIEKPCMGYGKQLADFLTHQYQQKKNQRFFSS